MRFLLFNLVVAAALIYLLSDGGMSERVRQTVDLVRDRVAQPLTGADPAAQTPPPVAAQAVEPAPEPTAEQSAAPVIAAKTRTSPRSSAARGAPTIKSWDPSRSRSAPRAML